MTATTFALGVLVGMCIAGALLKGLLLAANLAMEACGREMDRCKAQLIEATRMLRAFQNAQLKEPRPRRFQRN